ncbi:MAG TPA: hypothetical protein VMG12_05310 [Polyangiaceae bacterium]|nr:hypothetical protein [Polyangiaceae bacterium]
MFNFAKRRLWRDESGGLLLVGILMGALLVGGLWYLASIGDAILWREQAQDAADAAAFENAVWNARGMNVLVLLNMLMALVMAILVIWRTLILFLSVLIAVIAIACALGFLIPNPISTVACTLARAIPRMAATLARMKRIDDQISARVVKITHALATSQKVVAGAIPPIGAIVAMKDTNDAFDVSAAWTFSTSALPNIEQGLRLGVGKNPGFECDEAADNYSPKDFLQPRVGYVFSLPAQEDQWSVLCSRAAQLVPNNLAAVLERTGAPQELISAFNALSLIVGPIAGTFPTVFCAPGGTQIPKAVSDLVDGVARDRCKKEEEGVMVDGKKKYRKPNPDSPGDFLDDEFVDAFDMGKCMEGQAKKASIGKIDGRKPTCSKPFKVWDYAANGNIAMQSFSFVDKEAPMLSRDDDGLDIADGNDQGNVAEVDPPWIRAQAEMYYDCRSPAPVNPVPGFMVGALSWEQCRTHAPWTLNWRARLRRIQRLEDMAARAGERVMVESLINGANKMLGRAAKNALTRRGFPDILSENSKDTWATMEVRNFARRVAYWSIGGRIFASPPTGPTVIH